MYKYSFGHHCSQSNSIAESKIIFYKGCTKSRHSNVKPIEPEAPKTDNKALGLDEVSQLHCFESISISARFYNLSNA